LISGKIIGDQQLTFSGIANIEDAGEEDISFLFRPKYFNYLGRTKAKVLIVSEDAPKTRNDITYIETKNPNLAIHTIISNYFLSKPNLEGINPEAYISPKAKIGKGISIGFNVVISDRVKIGDNVKIFHNCVLMEDVKIGTGTIIYPNVTIRENCIIGDNVILHSGVVVGSDGFGYTPNEDGTYKKIPQIGNVVIENDVEIGSNTTIDRAALGSTIIRKGSKIDNLVQIAHNVKIGKSTAISAQSGISGSTEVGNYCIFGGQVGLSDHIEITDNVLIGAQSGIPKSITKSGKYFGTPAKELYDELRVQGHIRNLDKYSKKIKELEKRLAVLENKIKSDKEL
jgi:UDP-3-O-[3-hydroxymyristoyl] glucosamine N-acyltransferase